MTTDAHSLMTLYKGWDDYQISLVRALMKCDTIDLE